jgi:hypothetical protein
MDPSGVPYPNAPAGEDTDGDGLVDTPEALLDHHANQQIFAWICGMTIGVTTLDPTACGNTIFNSYQNLFTSQPATDPLTQPTLSSFASGLLAANTGALGFASAPQAFDVDLPAIRLNRDVGDTRPQTGFFASNPAFDTLNAVLTAQQQALLGCGEYYATDCDVQGFDLLNAEASALFQSFSGFEGTASVATSYNWDLTDPTVAQPGTVEFRGGPVCSRFDGNGIVTLPGCRGPGDPGYDPAIDGTTAGLMIPFFDPSSSFYMGPFDLDGDGVPESPTPAFDPTFATEFAAISWNSTRTISSARTPARSRRRTSASVWAASSTSPASSAPPSGLAATPSTGAATSCGRWAPRSRPASRSATCSASRWTGPRTSPRATGASRPPGSRGSRSSTAIRSRAPRTSIPTTSR